MTVEGRVGDVQVSRSAPCTLMRVQTSDGLSLQGLAFERLQASGGVALLHIHGLAGNFYENIFVESIAEATGSKGVSMFSVSTRGRDYEADFLRQTEAGTEEVRIGSAHEILTESALDIAAWLDGMESLGIRKVILQGHSLGTLKVASYVAKTKDPRVAACILLSPADMVGIQRERLGSVERWQALLSRAHQMADRGDGGEYLPPDSFYCPTTAVSYLDKYGTLEWDIFPIERSLRGDNPNWALFKAIKVPVMVVYGTENEAVVGNHVVDACRVLAEFGPQGLVTRVVTGADHVYRGHEQELAAIVGEWVDRVL